MGSELEKAKQELENKLQEVENTFYIPLCKKKMKENLLELIRCWDTEEIRIILYSKYDVISFEENDYLLHSASPAICRERLLNSLLSKTDESFRIFLQLMKNDRDDLYEEYIHPFEKK